MTELALQQQIRDLKRRIDAIESREPGGTLTNYFSTSSKIGWSAYNAGEQTLGYMTRNGLMFVQFFIGGTSNNTASIVSMPYANAGNTLRIPIRIIDNGTAAVGYASIATLATDLFFYPAITGGNWTASGAKSVIGEFWIEV